MRRGIPYQVAIMDWATRKVLGRNALGQLSNTMDAGFCVATLEEALARFGKPEIFNTDQGSLFTSFAFTSMLHEAEVSISMDVRGRWITYYNTQRPHSGLTGITPVEAYRRIGQSDHGVHAPHDLIIKQAA